MHLNKCLGMVALIGSIPAFEFFRHSYLHVYRGVDILNLMTNFHRGDLP